MSSPTTQRFTAFLHKPWLKRTLLGLGIFLLLFGLFAYATYDLTNLATLRNWPTALTLVDIGWGVVLSAAASTCGYALATRFASP